MAVYVPPRYYGSWKGASEDVKTGKHNSICCFCIIDFSNNMEDGLESCETRVQQL